MTNQVNLDDDGIGTDDGEVDITLPAQTAEAALILLDVNIDRSDIDATELEQERLKLVHLLREALGVSDEGAQDDTAPVGDDGCDDDSDDTETEDA